MRHVLFAVLLGLWAGVAQGYTLEAQRSYPGGDEPLRILSTADVEVFEPLIAAFQAENPALSITYDVASSAEVMRAIHDEGAAYDLVISSAMDLQIKLANDGFARSHRSARADAAPEWARWRSEVYAFTREPAVLVISKAAFADLPLPATRTGLIRLLREHPQRFMGKIGSYDPAVSGLGYLFATQDSRNTETFWQLAEVMGRLDARLYCCSGAMIGDVANGELSIAYNVLGSYANARVAADPGLQVIEMDDYISVMLRTALVPRNAENPSGGGAMIDFLLSDAGQDLLGQVGLPPLQQAGIDQPALRPIRLGPELLVYLDHLRRETFLRNWRSSIEQD